MEFEFTHEHEELRQTARRFLEKKSPETVVRGVMETERGYDERVWSRMAEEMGLPGLIVPEEHGGAGLGFVELAIVLEEMGRALLCAPYLSTAVHATSALLHAAGKEAAAEILPGIAAGRTIATVALAEESGRREPGAIALRARRDGGGWALEGVKEYVLDGHVADVILVAARTGEGLSLFQVDGGAARLDRKLLPTLDLTRKLARLRFSGTPAARIGADVDCSAAFERVLAAAATALAAEQVGGTQRCLEMATDYAKTRLQFGRPIGSYQAIKHKCADMLVEVELARSAAYNAAFRAAGTDLDELLTAAHMAKAFCSETYFHAAAENIQIHGGMGFTWEHPAHLYFKRAKSSALLFGDPVHHRQRLAERVGI